MLLETSGNQPMMLICFIKIQTLPQAWNTIIRQKWSKIMLHFSRISILQIHCIVGAKISKTDVPCFTAGSSLFFAGIKVALQRKLLKYCH